MIYTSKFSKGLIIFLVYNIMIILTITCNYTLIAVVDDVNDTENKLIAEQNNLQIKENVQETVGVEGVGITNNKNQPAPIMNCIREGIYNVIYNIDRKFKITSKHNDNMAITQIEINGRIDIGKTPACYYSKFFFTSYAPLSFHYLRVLFEIETKDYLDSFYEKPLRELSNLGASGSMFYITENDKFIIKTVQNTEVGFLQQILPNYINYLEENPRSMLSKFSGLYSYKYNSVTGTLVSMNNFLPSNIEIHQKYDLKGSTYGRNVSDEEKLKTSRSFKDINFTVDYQDGIFLMPETRSALLSAINVEFDFLKGLNIMDYSILMGVHNIDKVSELNTPLHQAAAERWKRLMVKSIGMDSIQANTDTMPEKNFSSLRGSIPAKNGSGERLLLFVGIIDILQQYGLLKVVEHKFKVILQSKDVSVQNPETYATRLYNFLSESVFKSLFREEDKNLSKQQPIKSLSKIRKLKNRKTLSDNLKQSKIYCC